MEGHLKTLVANGLQSGRPMSVLIADIDHFKQLNDTYGHDAGDAVLREFAARLRRNTRGIDLACRLGGEEFIVIMPDTELSRAYQVAERLRACIAADPFPVSSSQKIPVTASVGLSTLENADDTPETLYKRADNALYAAKRRGRNRVVADAA
jgi:two-component system cell cycle response regulator